MKKPPFSKQYTIKSFGTPTVVDFETVQTESTRTGWITVQPLDARTLVELDQGIRTRARYAAFTYETFVIAKPGGPRPDQVQVNGAWFEVAGGFDDGLLSPPAFGNEYILLDPEKSA